MVELRTHVEELRFDVGQVIGRAQAIVPAAENLIEPGVQLIAIARAVVDHADRADIGDPVGRRAPHVGARQRAAEVAQVRRRVGRRLVTTEELRRDRARTVGVDPVHELLRLDGRVEGCSRQLAHDLGRHEEERAVPFDRSAQAAAEVVAVEIGFGDRPIVEVSARAKVLVPVELVHGAAERVRSTFGDHADRRPRVPAVLGRRVVGNHLVFLDRVDVGHDDDGPAPRAVVDARAVDRRVVPAFPHAVGRDAHALFGRQEVLRAGDAVDAGLQRRKRQHVAADEREVVDLLLFDDGGDVGLLGLYVGCDRRHRDRLRQVPGLHREVDAECRADRDDEVRLRRGAESGQLRDDFVAARLEAEHAVEARFIGRGAARHAGIEIGNGHRDARHDAVCLVRDSALNAPELLLGAGGRGRRPQGGERESDEEKTSHTGHGSHLTVSAYTTTPMVALT